MKSIFSTEQIAETKQLIDLSSRIVILTHMSPDGDAMGSSLAMRHYLEGLGKEVNIIVPNSFPNFLAWLPKANEDLIYEKQQEEADQLIDAADLIICTDFNDPKRIGSLGDKMLSTKCKRILIDHHLHPSNFADILLSYPASPSTCELVYRLLKEFIEQDPTGTSLTLDIATCIYTGMMTDTGNFSFNSNYPETYEIISHLVSLGINKDSIYNAVFNAYTVDRMRLMGYCLYEKMKIYAEHHCALITLSSEELRKFNFQSGDAEGIVNLPLQIKDVHYSCFMREDRVNPTEIGLAGGSDKKIKISLRSQGDRPVNIFAHDVFSGGGHANASGGEFYGALEDAIKQFDAHYKDYFTK